VSWKETKSRSGLGNVPNLFEGEYNTLTDCPNCGGIHTLNYGITEEEIDDMSGETLTVEGLICSDCRQIFMNTEEGARFLNEQAKRVGSEYRYITHNGEIIETLIQ
jgi:hypothetical protein